MRNAIVCIVVIGLLAAGVVAGDGTSGDERRPGPNPPDGEAAWVKYPLRPSVVKIEGGIRENIPSRFALIDLWEEHSVFQFVVKNDFKTSEIKAVGGKVLDKYTLTFLDLTRNGKFGDIPEVEQVKNENEEHLWSLVDGIVVNQTKDCIPMSNVILLGKTLYEIRPDPAGAFVETREYRGPAGTIKGGGKYASLSARYIIVRGGNNFYRIEEGKEMTVPAGSYSLWRGGFVVERKASRPIPESSQTYPSNSHWGFKHRNPYLENKPTEFAVGNGERTTIPYGSPATIKAMVYGFYPDGKMEIINMTARGAGGELLPLEVADIGKITLHLKGPDNKVAVVKPDVAKIHELSP